MNMKCSKSHSNFSYRHYKETLKVQPFDAEAHTGIGFAYGKIGQTKEAIHH